MNKRVNKKGEILGLSFGMIFSILLIIFFVVIAFIVIKKFLGVGDCAKIGIFVERLEGDVKKTWNSQIDSHEFEGAVPGKIDYICFMDFLKEYKGNYKDFEDELGRYEESNYNLFFYPTANACDIPAHTIDHVDIEKITLNRNPFCVKVNKGKINLIIEKELNDPLVKISQVNTK